MLIQPTQPFKPVGRLLRSVGFLLMIYLGSKRSLRGTKVSTPTPCLVCGKALDAAANDKHFATTPYAATQFTTLGHYGSTVFDPNISSVEEMLEINVCDDCLVERTDRVVLLRRVYTPNPQPNYSREPWNPKGD